MTGRGDGTLKLRRNGSCLAPALSGAKWLHLRCESDVGVVEFCLIPERSWEIPETAYLPCFNKGTALNHCLQALQNNHSRPLSLLQQSKHSHENIVSPRLSNKSKLELYWSR